MQKLPPKPRVRMGGSGTQTVELDYGGAFIGCMRWEAVPSSQMWRKRWEAPDFGRFSVQTVRSELPLDRGVPLPWRRSEQGFPEVVLHVSLAFPNLQRRPLTESFFAGAWGSAYKP